MPIRAACDSSCQQRAPTPQRLSVEVQGVRWTEAAPHSLTTISRRPLGPDPSSSLARSSRSRPEARCCCLAPAACLHLVAACPAAAAGSDVPPASQTGTTLLRLRSHCPRLEAPETPTPHARAYGPPRPLACPSFLLRRAPSPAQMRTRSEPRSALRRPRSSRRRPSSSRRPRRRSWCVHRGAPGVRGRGSSPLCSLGPPVLPGRAASFPSPSLVSPVVNPNAPPVSGPHPPASQETEKKIVEQMNVAMSVRFNLLPHLRAKRAQEPATPSGQVT